MIMCCKDVTGQVPGIVMVLSDGSGHPGLACGELDQGVEKAEAVFGGGGQVAADGAELAG